MTPTEPVAALATQPGPNAAQRALRHVGRAVRWLFAPYNPDAREGDCDGWPRIVLFTATLAMSPIILPFFLVGSGVAFVVVRRDRIARFLFGPEPL